MGINNRTKVGEMYRFFVDKNQILENEIIITGADVNHIKNVLRMKLSEEMILSDGENCEYRCLIKGFSETEVLTEIMYKQEPGIELKSQIYLFQGLPKSDKMELIIQKAVELGVFQIVPVAMKRSVVKLDSKKEANKLKRWRTIAESAAKQAKRMIIPEVSGIKTFDEAVTMASSLDICLMPYEKAEDIKDTKAFLSTIEAGKSIGVFIGPEGGFAAEEVSAATDNAVKAITLGKRILRTETAGITMLSILMFLMEEA